MAKNKAKSAAKRRPVKRAAKKVAAKKKPVPRPTKHKDGGPLGWPTLSPYMVVRNGQAALDFYSKAFGFKVTGMLMRDDAGRVLHAGMALGEAAIMFGPIESSEGLQPPAGGPDSLSLYVYVPDVDALASRAQAAGATVVMAAGDRPWRDRTAVFKDPDGFHWTFATHLG